MGCTITCQNSHHGVVKDCSRTDASSRGYRINTRVGGYGVPIPDSRVAGSIVLNTDVVGEKASAGSGSGHRRRAHGDAYCGCGSSCVNDRRDYVDSIDWT